MKNLIILSILIFITSNFAIGQDIITKKTGEDIEAKVIEITIDEVKFKKWNNLDGPIFGIYKSDVLIIRYKNGTKDIFSSESKSDQNITSEPSFSKGANNMPINSNRIDNSDQKNNLKSTQDIANQSTDLFNDGKLDARRFYNGHVGAGTGTLLTGIFAGSISSLVPAIMTSSYPPHESNLNFPDYSKMQNKDYHFGYTKEAFRIKKQKVWSNWGIGLMVNVITYFVLIKK